MFNELILCSASLRLYQASSPAELNASAAIQFPPCALVPRFEIFSETLLFPSKSICSTKKTHRLVLLANGRQILSAFCERILRFFLGQRLYLNSLEIMNFDDSADSNFRLMVFRISFLTIQWKNYRITSRPLSQTTLQIRSRILFDNSYLISSHIFSPLRTGNARMLSAREVLGSLKVSLILHISTYVLRMPAARGSGYLFSQVSSYNILNEKCAYLFFL